MSEDKLGPMPDPVVEPPADNPGGADAINDDAPFTGDGGVLARDLHPEDNPGVEDQMPEELGQTDDKQQEPSDDAGDDPEVEEPA